jgi:hypothetical protein
VPVYNQFSRSVNHFRGPTYSARPETHLLYLTVSVRGATRASSMGEQLTLIAHGTLYGPRMSVVMR